MQNSIYFGGSRHLGYTNLIPAVIDSAIWENNKIHVGCQWGADHQVIKACFLKSFLVVFAVAGLNALPPHVELARKEGAEIRVLAGGVGPIKSRYLLRSKAAFENCSQAVFFQPGPGSLAVARECAKSGLPVWAFGREPAPIPGTPGTWWLKQNFGLACWSFQPAQIPFENRPA